MSSAVHRPQAAPLAALLEEAPEEAPEELEVLLELVDPEDEEPDPLGGEVEVPLSEEEPVEEPDEAGSLAVLALRLSVR